MSEGSEVCGGTGRGLGRGAGRGTAGTSAGGVVDSAGPLEVGGWELDGFKPSSFDFDGVIDGLGVFTASAFSMRFGFGLASSDPGFFFDEALFLVPPVSVALAFGFGVGSSSSSPDFFPGDFVALGLGVGDWSSSVAPGVFFGFGFGVGDSSSSSSPAGIFFAFCFGVTSSSSSPLFLLGDFDALGFGVGDSSSSSSPAGVFLAFGFGVGVAFFFDFRFAGFGFAVGSGVSDGVGDATARISSRAFFFFSSVDCARTNTPRRATTEKIVPRKTRSRITGGERNRGDCAIKRAVAPPRAHARPAPARAAKSRSVFHREAKADR